MTKSELEKLVKSLHHHKDLYYNKEPQLSDAEFDALEEKLRDADPTNSYFDLVGSPSSGDIIHKIPMLSMGKGNMITDITAWTKSIKITPDEVLVGEPKIDGISATVSYDSNGRLMYVATRGNGYIGKRIKFGHLISGIPNKIPKRDGAVEIRGEIYIKKSLIHEYPELKGKPLRNLASGIIKLEEKSYKLDFLSFVAYDMVPPNPLKNVTSLLFKIAKLGFDVVEHVRIEGVKDVKDFMNKYLKELRDKWDYETDGVIFVIHDMTKYDVIDSIKKVMHHHHYNIAFKPPAKGQNTTIQDIKWNVSRYGKLVPVGVIQPIVIDNVTITSVSLNNVSYLKNLNMGPGDKVRVVRANDVIPKLVNVIRRRQGDVQRFKIPKKCPICGYKPLKKRGVDLICENKFCDGRVQDKINKWISGVGIDRAGPGFVRDTYENEIILSITDIYRKDLADCLSLVPRYGEKKITTICENIEKSKKNMTEIDIIANIGIPMVGRDVLKKYNINSVKDLYNISKEYYGFAVIQSIINWLEDKTNIKLLEDLVKIIKPVKVKVHKSNGKSVCITGKFDKSRNEIISELVDKGYTVVKSVNKTLTYLLTGEGCEGGSKYNKAKSLGIKMVKEL